ncbi:YoaK family protein [Azohydromonas caseinilytica]|uniref:DUF1275 domain-containing protein n=1 Tax=Azohydromonas caseinilytica TaxID=2728836 RepID=A0A848FAU9_9BURK|nr:YoaK family protein [Azohydromonas caseinilytica]NML16418.1 DUF1275 domain-containing protein [Azohydromonas caseinilytica]
MPIHYSRRLTGRRRSAGANRQLGVVLAFVAGAANAGGFLAVHQYTSHMTGIVSAMADHLALGELREYLAGFGALLSFIAGSACTAILVNLARRRRMHSEYALPLVLEAVLLLGFGVLGERLSGVTGLFVPFTVMWLSFIMGLQNALVTKLSRAEIRTTHVTGLVTDVGIELGKLLYWNSPGLAGQPKVQANRARLQILLALAAAFFVGGVCGALGFKLVGYAATVPLAFVLIVLASVPAIDDLSRLGWSFKARA